MRLVASLSEKWRVLSESQAGGQFSVSGYLYIPSFVDNGSLRCLQAIWDEVKNSTLRREITIEHQGVSSDRRMYTASAVTIDKATNEIDGLYRNDVILDALSQIAGEPIEPLDDSIEKYVINQLVRKGDQHGAHVDSFPFSCSYVISSPRVEQGGTLIISNNADDALAFRGARFVFSPGDLFFFRSNILFHQVSPLLTEANRIVLNMAYATPQTRNRLSYSRSTLYS